MGKERLTLFFLFFKVVLQPSSGKGESLFHVTLSQFHTTTHTVGNDSQAVAVRGHTLHAYRKETEHYPGLSTSIQLSLALVNFHSLKTPSLRNITIFSEKLRTCHPHAVSLSITTLRRVLTRFPGQFSVVSSRMASLCILIPTSRLCTAPQTQ